MVSPVAVSWYLARFYSQVMSDQTTRMTLSQTHYLISLRITDSETLMSRLFPSRNSDGSSLAKMSTVRALSVVGLSVYSPKRWLTRFLHSGRWWIGTLLINWFWKYMTNMMLGNKYSKSENGRRLKPEPDRYALRASFTVLTPLHCCHESFMHCYHYRCSPSSCIIADVKAYN
jgi:hypothetical protein